MSESLSSQILARLRREAEKLGRPEQRLATLERLVEACNSIADGSARAIVRRGNLSAEVNFRRASTPIIPPRIQDYVLARRTIDQRKGIGGSVWTGPVASSLRKEGDGMLAYVRAREQERVATASPLKAATKLEWWHLVDGVTDDAVKARLMRELSEGSEAKRAVATLKAAVRLCSPSFDVDAYLRGDESCATPVSTPALPSPKDGAALSPGSKTAIAQLTSRLTDNTALAAFDLEWDGKRVRQRTSKETFASLDEIAALQAAIKPD